VVCMVVMLLDYQLVINLMQLEKVMPLRQET
jgi:hypothetical protein